MNIVEIPLSDLDNVWNLVKKDIAQALSYSGNYTDSDFVLDQLKQKKFQLWVLWDKTKQTTTMTNHPNKVLDCTSMLCLCI